MGGLCTPARVVAWLWVSHHLAPVGHWVGPGLGAKSQGGFTNISVHVAGCSPVCPSQVSMPRVTPRLPPLPHQETLGVQQAGLAQASVELQLLPWVPVHWGSL